MICNVNLRAEWPARDWHSYLKCFEEIISHLKCFKGNHWRSCAYLSVWVGAHESEGLRRNFIVNIISNSLNSSFGTIKDIMQWNHVYLCIIMHLVVLVYSVVAGLEAKWIIQNPWRDQGNGEHACKDSSQYLNLDREAWGCLGFWWWLSNPAFAWQKKVCKESNFQYKPKQEQ